MSEISWKKAERDGAKLFGTERNPLSGRWSKHGTESDTLHSGLYIEVKRDKKYLGKTFLGLLKGTVELAKKERKAPVILLKEHGHPGFWVVTHSKYLSEIAKEVL